MARTRPWEVSNELWERVRPLIPSRPPKLKGGHPPKDDRQMFEAILFVLRTGMQWNVLPRAIAASTAVYDRFRLWMADGFFHAWWEAGANPADRGKLGTKRSQLSEGHGLPVALRIDGANVHDTNLMAVTLDAIILKRPPPTEQPPQHLCLDAGYAGKRTEKAVRARGSIPHVRPRGEERGKSESRDAKKRPRRWVVERLYSWLNRSRRLLIQWEKLSSSYEAFLHLACALICFQQCDRLGISYSAAEALSQEARSC